MIGNIILSATYDDHIKFDIREMGGEWDSNFKEWYIPNNASPTTKLNLLMKFPVNLEKLEMKISFRDFNIILIPKPCWFRNITYYVDPKEFYRIKRCLGSKCVYCSTDGEINIEEIWNYNMETKIIKLNGLMNTCKQCYNIIHIGKSGLYFSDSDELCQNYMHLKYNFKCDESDMEGAKLVLEEDMEKAGNIFKEQNKIEWSDDITWLTEQNIKLKNNN